MKKGLIILLIGLVTAPLAIFANNEPAKEHAVRLSWKTDMVSSHIWRGFANSNTVCFEPELSLSWQNLNFSVWGAWAVDEQYSELDLILSYQLPGVSITLYDYYCPVPDGENQFINFSGGDHRHSLELAAEVKGPAWFPVNILIANFLYGDYNHLREEQYSTYVEGNFAHQTDKFQLQVFAGLTPGKGYYYHKFAVVNTGLALTFEPTLHPSLSMPVWTKYHFNPATDSHFLVLGISLKGN